MKNKPSLADFGTATATTALPPPPPANDASPLADPLVKRTRKNAKQTGEEVIQLGFRLPRSRWQKLHELALHDRSSVQSILVGALEAHFKAKGLNF